MVSGGSRKKRVDGEAGLCALLLTFMRHSYGWNLHVLRSLISGHKDPTLIRDDESRRSPGESRRLGAVSGRDWMGWRDRLHAA